MFGYIFETTNKKTGKTYLGKCYSVKFDKNLLGVDNALIEKYGKENFSVKMIRAFEEQEVLDWVFDDMTKSTKSNESVEPKVEPVEPKVENENKTRKKRTKAVEE